MRHAVLYLAAVLILSSAAVVRAQDFEILDTDERRALRLPTSEAVRLGDQIFLSGVIGLRPGTLELVPGGIQAETRQAMESIRNALERYGSSMNRVAKCTVILADINEWNAMNEVYVTFFLEGRPARTAFAATGLPLGARVEIDCIAAAGTGD